MRRFAKAFLRNARPPKPLVHRPGSKSECIRNRAYQDKGAPSVLRIRATVK